MAELVLEHGVHRAQARREPLLRVPPPDLTRPKALPLSSTEAHVLHALERGVERYRMRHDYAVDAST